MAARVENGVKPIHINIAQLFCAGEGFFGVGICLKAMSCFRKGLFGFTVRIDGWLSTLWRCDGYVCAGIAERVVGRGEFFQPVLHRKNLVKIEKSQP